MKYCKPCLMYHEGNCTVAKVKEFLRLLFGFYWILREAGRKDALRRAWELTTSNMAYDPEEHP